MKGFHKTHIAFQYPTKEAPEVIFSETDGANPTISFSAGRVLSNPQPFIVSLKQVNILRMASHSVEEALTSPFWRGPQSLSGPLPEYW